MHTSELLQKACGDRAGIASTANGVPLLDETIQGIVGRIYLWWCGRLHAKPKVGRAPYISYNKRSLGKAGQNLEMFLYPKMCKPSNIRKGGLGVRSLVLRQEGLER